ncbi:penicillin-binding transpeptidase domain-containing protein [Acidovorax sp. NPDC077664]|uniref:penicillin-binding transpeptidase domain-containing protein n=1 Tax=Acidovorax sp. NPDC077664 TaxID=3390544 RepID=UPI003CFC2C77
MKNSVTGVVTEIVQPPGENLGYSPKNVEIVRNALVAVNKGGTGTRVFAGAPYTSAGKTGTAQAVSLGQNVKYNAKALEEHQRDHSLFAAYAPAEAPSIALAVIVENSGFGAAHAAPIARRVFDYWLQGDYPSEEDIAAVQKGLASAPIGKPRRAADVALPLP